MIKKLPKSLRQKKLEIQSSLTQKIHMKLLIPIIYKKSKIICKIKHLYAQLNMMIMIKKCNKNYKFRYHLKHFDSKEEAE